MTKNASERNKGAGEDLGSTKEGTIKPKEGEIHPKGDKEHVSIPSNYKGKG